MATTVCHECDLPTFHFNLHPELVANGAVRRNLAEWVRKR